MFYQRFLSVLQDKKETYGLRASAARNLGHYKNQFSIEPLLTVLQEDPPLFPSLYNVENAREFFNESINYHLLLNAIFQTTEYYKLRITTIKALIRLNAISSVPILMQELLKSMKADSINLLLRRITILLQGNKRKIVNNKAFEMNRIKVVFQKEILHAIGKFNNPIAIPVLFRIYYSGTSRLWKYALDALNQIQDESVTPLLLKLFDMQSVAEEQYFYLRRLFLKRDLIPYINNASQSQFQLIHDVILEQGPQNLGRLEFLYETTKNTDLQSKLKEMIGILQPKVNSESGFILVL